MKGFVNTADPCSRSWRWTGRTRTRKSRINAPVEERKEKDGNVLKQNGRMIVGDESVEFGYRQLDKEQERLVEAMVAAVFDGKAEKITLRIENVNISVKDVDGKVKIQRSDTNKTERSA